MLIAENEKRQGTLPLGALGQSDEAEATSGSVTSKNEEEKTQSEQEDSSKVAEDSVEEIVQGSKAKKEDVDSFKSEWLPSSGKSRGELSKPGVLAVHSMLEPGSL